VLDDLAHEDRTERAVGGALQVFHEVGLLDFESVATRVGDHVGVGIDAACLHARFAQETKQLAAPTAGVEHGSRVAQDVDVETLAVADRVDAAAHSALEGEVVRNRSRGRLCGDGHRCRHATGCGTPPLEPREPFLQLTHEPFRLLARGRRVVHTLDALVQTALQDDPVTLASWNIVQRVQRTGRSTAQAPATTPTPTPTAQ